MPSKPNLQKISSAIDLLRTESSTEIERLHKVVKSRTTERDELKQENAKIKVELDNLKVEYRKLKDTRAHQDKKLKTIESELAFVQDALQSSTVNEKKHEKISSQLSVEKKSLQMETKRLETQLLEQDKRYADLKAELIDSQKQNETHIASIETLKQKITVTQNVAPVQTNVNVVPPNVSQDVSVHMIKQTELIASYTEQLRMMMSQNKMLLENQAALQALNLELIQRLHKS